MGDSDAVSRLKNQQRMGGAGVLIAFSHDPLPATINHERWRGRRDQALEGRQRPVRANEDLGIAIPGVQDRLFPLSLAIGNASDIVVERSPSQA
jgi:hypothetical protein